MLEGKDFDFADNVKDRLSPPRLNQGVEEMLSWPDVVVMIFVSVFALFAGAIRLTRVSVDTPIQSFQTYVESEQQLSRKGLLNWIRGKFPRRIWNFYVEGFLIPGYRKEWGQYRVWSFRSRERPPKPKHIQKILRAQKQRRREQQCANKDDMDLHNLPPHNHASCQRVSINVCGLHYETQLRTLERFPDTLLGNPEKRNQYFDSVKQEYYFDRNRQAFEAILHFYQSGGRFRRPDNVQADVLLGEAQFYELSPAVINQYRIDEGLSPPSSKHEIVPQSLLRRKIWLLFDVPESSRQAAYVAVLSIGALFLSIAVFCIETLEDFELKETHGVIDRKTGYIAVNHKVYLDYDDPFFLTEFACNIWFIIEFLTRFLCCPLYLKFLKSPFNIIDLIAVTPFLISIGSPTTSRFLTNDSETNASTTAATDSLYLLRLARVVRVFRIFKLSRHSKGLKILGKTLHASLNELVLLIFFIILGVILFSSTMYFAELDYPSTQYESIPDGFWWALITITTVGFGDVVPKTFAGKVVGALCAVAGVLTIALPVPVIVSNFNFFYQQAIDEGDLRWININHVPACPYRPGGYSQSSVQEKESSRKEKNAKYSSDEEFQHLKNRK